MEYVETKIVAQGLYDRLQFNAPSKLLWVDILRQLLRVAGVKLFVRLRDGDFTRAFRFFPPINALAHVEARAHPLCVLLHNEYRRPIQLSDCLPYLHIHSMVS